MIRDKRIVYAELFGQQHPMCLTVAAADRVDETFGNFKQLQERLQAKQSAEVVEAMMQFAAIMLEGGRDRVLALAAMQGEAADLPSVFDLRAHYKLLAMGELSALAAAATRAFVIGNSQTVEVAQSKKEEPTQ